MILKISIAIACLIGLATLGLAEPPSNLKPIGGHWYVTTAEPAMYFYEDAGQYVDLFSHHQLDSNKDGIPNLRLSHDETALIVRSQGYPNHPTAIFPNSGNPNEIRVQDFTFRLPLQPRLADQITRLPMGPTGMALNGVVFFNPFEQGGMNAVEGYSEVWLDSCCGHPQQTGVYHYHKYPTCVKSPFKDDGQQHSPIIGFAFDGFPVYGPYESQGKLAKDLTDQHALDVCSGHRDEQRGYHYHVTPGRFPYILGGYAGVPEASNNRGLRRAGTGPIENNASGESRMSNTISRVAPGSAKRGARHKIQLELDPAQSRRPIPTAKPDWVQIGPYEAKSIERDGNTITFEIEVDSEASSGVLLDCHIEFAPADAGGRRLVFKKNDAFRIID